MAVNASKECCQEAIDTLDRMGILEQDGFLLDFLNACLKKLPSESSIKDNHRQKVRRSRKKQFGGDK